MSRKVQYAYLREVHLGVNCSLVTAHSIRRCITFRAQRSMTARSWAANSHHSSSHILMRWRSDRTSLCKIWKWSNFTSNFRSLREFSQIMQLTLSTKARLDFIGFPPNATDFVLISGSIPAVPGGKNASRYEWGCTDSICFRGCRQLCVITENNLPDLWEKVQATACTWSPQQEPVFEVS